MKRLIFASIATLCVSAPAAFADENCGAITPGKGQFPKHVNLSKAFCHLNDAAVRITDAQKANDFQLGGHAAKAKELIEQAMEELKQARDQANANKKL